MCHIGKKLAPRHILFGKFLIGICQFRCAQAQVFNCQLIVLTKAVADLADHRHGYTWAVFQDSIESLLVEFQHNDIAQCRNRCGAGRIMDKRHLSEKIPRGQRF